MIWYKKRYKNNKQRHHFMNLYWCDLSRKQTTCLPVSILAMIVPSPNFALVQAEFAVTRPFFSSPRKSHDLVVCNLCSLLRKTETTFGFSAPMQNGMASRCVQNEGHAHNYLNNICLPAISAASSSSSRAAKPLICLL